MHVMPKRKLIVASKCDMTSSLTLATTKKGMTPTTFNLECIVCVLIFGFSRLVSTCSLTDITVWASRLLHVLSDDRARDTLVLFDLRSYGRVMVESDFAVFLSGIPAALPFLTIYGRALRLLLDMDGAAAEKRHYCPYAATIEGHTASGILPHSELLL
jgi:hypothetical protein